MLFVQMCSKSPTMLCRTDFGKMHYPLFSAALQDRLAAASVSLQSHPWRFALHTGVQRRNTNALHLCSGQKVFPIVQCWSAKQAHSRQCITAVTPMEICSSYRCAVTQQQCTAALFGAKCIPYCSVLLCTTGSQQAVCHCNHT